MSVASMVSPFTACAVAVFILYIASVPSVMFIGIYTFPFFAYTVLPIRYSATDRVSDIVEDNPQLLLVLNRFKIPFGFGCKP